MFNAQFIFGLLYALLFFCYVVTALFIVYHIARYSFQRSTAIFGTTLFLIVFLLLVFTNAFIFFSLPWNDLLPVLL